PVPGTQMLFSVWETRHQDYAPFAGIGSGSEDAWREPRFRDEPVTPGPTHPVVNVSWDDARAFAKWLTHRERVAGRITASAEYRLPTDLEWSAAAGLTKETGAWPLDRLRAAPEIFPWGRTWPPPETSGNY